MRKLNLFLFACFTVGMLSAGNNNALTVKQSIDQTVVFKDWTMLAESENLIDVNYRVVKCNSDGNTQILVMIFNENSIEQNAKFTLTISDANSGNSFQKSFDKTVPLATIFQAECTSNDYDDQKIDLPEGYDASSLTITIEFN